MSRKRYFISACLLGQKVRYDAQDCLIQELFERISPNQYISLCPEITGGLPTPRPPAEIQFGSGQDVLNGKVPVLDINGDNVSSAFMDGAVGGQ